MSFLALKSFTHENTYVQKGAILELGKSQITFLLEAGFIMQVGADGKPAPTDGKPTPAPITKRSKK
jgi:hypothetical protein